MKDPSSQAPPGPLPDCTRANSDNPGAAPGRRSHLGNGLMSAVLVTAGAFKGPRSSSNTLRFSPLMGQAQKWFVSCYHCCLKWEGATSQEQEREDILPVLLACIKALAKPLRLSVPQFPPPVKWGVMPTSQGCCEV